ncbi:MAG: hypothetical protein WCL24_00085 [Verrucomicrobiota bacterium]
MKPPPDCLACGACCCSPAERFIRVTGDDWGRLGEGVEKCAHFLGHRAFMKMTGGRCAALEIRAAPGRPTECFCTCYAQRPQICRELARGSPECAGERARPKVLLGARQPAH